MNQIEMSSHLMNSVELCSNALSVESSKAKLKDVDTFISSSCHSKCSHLKCCMINDDNDDMSNEYSVPSQDRYTKCDSCNGSVSVKLSYHDDVFVSDVSSPVPGGKCYGDTRFVENKIKIQNEQDNGFKSVSQSGSSTHGEYTPRSDYQKAQNPRERVTFYLKQIL